MWQRWPEPLNIGSCRIKMSNNFSDIVNVSDFEEI